MPAASDAVRSARTWIVRAIVASLSLALVAGVGAASTEPAQAVNWSSQIAATRRSQLAYEASMLAADARLRSLKRDQRRTQRRLKKARRAIPRVTGRRDASRQRLADTRAELRVALATMEAFEPTPEPETPPESVVAPTAVTPSPLAPPVVRVPAWAQPPDRPDAGPFGAAMAQLVRTVTRAEVRTLQRQLRLQQRSHRKVMQKSRRVQRHVRSRQRRLASIRRQRRSAIAQRAGSEAALKGRILSMARLADRRALKKTKVRPGRSTPFVWPVRGRISQRYGCTGFGLNPSRGSCRHFHDGLDIVAGSGTPIRAAGVGVVSYVGRNPWDRGKRAFMVVLAHPGGYETLYAHVLPIRRVRVGQLVRKGEVIAYMGSTGHSTGTHLHLELRRGSVTVNPLAHL